eukprot:CAMPEP_0168618228 /NCGR_PEP_ID=MMETSP0449_2-20121227/5962_1 /TAXON_ID=1082188 /ORGANISM="Strombidium rassoulzadegani, Strain ras09" /LENGTH=58 /DNA_ID=CAMNT_0008659093 /DNA_START=1059 /DNA_END=1235 /DNA_ORIENTATION=+
MKKVIEKQYLKMGLDKNGLKNFSFEEFNIMDMYKLDEETACPKCRVNFKCNKHKYAKK